MKNHHTETSKTSLGQWNYFIEYKFIPDLLKAYLDGRCSLKILSDIDYWQQLFNNNYSDVCFSWENFKCEARQLTDDALLVIYIFPEPDDVPQAAFGAVYINEGQHKAEYYALEKSFDEQWHVGAQEGDIHLNFGRLEDSSLEAFVQWVINHCACK